MTVKITIIGLGQIGASFGLALSNQKELLERVGHDRDPGTSRKAKEMGALDRTDLNLHSAVQNADLILLTLPTDQIRETLEQIAPDLKESAVVMDTAPVKETVAAWAAELLPPERHYVGLTPVINPAYLHTTDTGLSGARADLFHNGLIAISSPPRTASEAIKLAADLTRLVGAAPLFTDTLEIDGLMAATHLLPQLLAAGLLNATIEQPGWREGRKVAGRAYAEASGPIVHLTGGQSLTTSVMLNRENVLRVLDGMMAALQAIRSDIDHQNQDSLQERLERARLVRETWWKQRQAGDWAAQEGGVQVDMPTTSSVFGRLFGLKPKTKK